MRVRAQVSAASLAISSPHLHRANRGSQGVLPSVEWGMGGNGQLIGSTVSDAIVRSWQWSTATGSSQLGYFSSITASS